MISYDDIVICTTKVHPDIFHRLEILPSVPRQYTLFKGDADF